MKNVKIPAFAHIEKTGGTSLIYALRRNFPLGHCDIIPQNCASDVVTSDDITHAGRIYPLLCSLSGHSIRPHLTLGEVGKRLQFYTVLRNGRDRYVSEYIHDTVKRGFSEGFEQWLKYEERWNFQTKAICGCDDFERAKSVLRERFSIVGVLEHYDEFVSSVATLFEQGFNQAYNHLNKAGLSKGNVHGEGSGRPEIPEHLLKKADEVNELDNKLHTYVKEILLPEQRAKLLAKHEASKSEENQKKLRFKSLRLYASTTYRNLVYKPASGLWPSEVHTLPVNRWNVREYRERRGIMLPG